MSDRRKEAARLVRNYGAKANRIASKLDGHARAALVGAAWGAGATFTDEALVGLDYIGNKALGEKAFSMGPEFREAMHEGHDKHPIIYGVAGAAAARGTTRFAARELAKWGPFRTGTSSVGASLGVKMTSRGVMKEIMDKAGPEFFVAAAEMTRLPHVLAKKVKRK